MNEFIEKLIGRLEEYRRLCKNTNIPCDMVVESCINIINELAEECKGGCCEWKKYENDIIFPYKTSCGNSDLYDDSYKFCPYCGKEIKVVE